MCLLLLNKELFDDYSIRRALLSDGNYQQLFFTFSSLTRTVRKIVAVCQNI